MVDLGFKLITILYWQPLSGTMHKSTNSLWLFTSFTQVARDHHNRQIVVSTPVLALLVNRHPKRHRYQRVSR